MLQRFDPVRLPGRLLFPPAAGAPPFMDPGELGILPDSDYRFLVLIVTAAGFLNRLPAALVAISGLGAIIDFWYFLRFWSFLSDA